MGYVCTLWHYLSAALGSHALIDRVTNWTLCSPREQQHAEPPEKAPEKAAQYSLMPGCKGGAQRPTYDFAPNPLACERFAELRCNAWGGYIELVQVREI